MLDYIKLSAIVGPTVEICFGLSFSCFGDWSDLCG